MLANDNPIHEQRDRLDAANGAPIPTWAELLVVLGGLAVMIAGLAIQSWCVIAAFQ